MPTEGHAMNFSICAGHRATMCSRALGLRCAAGHSDTMALPIRSPFAARVSRSHSLHAGQAQMSSPTSFIRMCALPLINVSWEGQPVTVQSGCWHHGSSGSSHSMQKSGCCMLPLVAKKNECIYPQHTFLTLYYARPSYRPNNKSTASKFIIWSVGLPYSGYRPPPTRSSSPRHGDVARLIILLAER